MLEIEYELTYLAKYLPDQISNIQPVKVVDYYLPEANTVHPHLRVRAKGNSKFEITKKQPLNGTDSSEQSEHTIVINEQEYKDIIANRKRSVIKDRYSTNYEGFALDVDVFQGSLKGLVLIDFEFKTKKQKEAFRAPDFCLADVTQEAFIAGGLLAGKSYADIEKELSKYNYYKIT
jgi:CYTH domain-containing protein